MKKLTFILPIVLIISLSSCSPKLIPRERIVLETYFDYSKHAKEGFLISPDPYTLQFESCGEILIYVYPAKTLKSQEENKKRSLNDLIYETQTTKSDHLETEEIPSEELLKIAVEKAKKVGANAIVNFKCVSKYNSYYSPPPISNYITIFSHFEISGFAIKRK